MSGVRISTLRPSLAARGPAYLLRPRGRPPTWPVLFIHGRSAGPTQAGRRVLPSLHRLLCGLAEREAAVLAVDTGPRSWGNDRAVASATAGVRAFARLGTPGPAAVIGFSMGHLTALVLAASLGDRVGPVAGLLPSSDLVALHDGPRRREIERAYRGRFADLALACPQHGSHDPLAVAAKLRGRVRWRGWFTADDAVVPASSVSTLAAAIDGTLTELGGGGHSDAAIARIDVEELASFLRGS